MNSALRSTGSSTSSGWRLITSATIFSFSVRKRLHVLYMSTPPGASSVAARSSSLRWSLPFSSTCSGEQRHFASGCLPHVPLPEQGASSSIVSGASSGSSVSESPHLNFTRSSARMRIISNCADLSFGSETSHASMRAPRIMSASCPVLTPRPQHMSSTYFPSARFASVSAASIDDSLCGIILPSPKPGSSSGKGFAAVRTERSKSGDGHAWRPELLYSAIYSSRSTPWERRSERYVFIPLALTSFLASCMESSFDHCAAAQPGTPQ